MLADDTAVRAVFLESGLLGRASPSTIHINMATISVALANDDGAERASAPVSV
jgi:3-hydroxyisobutyrate dehydrogenase-like beta-hydroxyacid dehydrogenase